MIILARAVVKEENLKIHKENVQFVNFFRETKVVASNSIFTNNSATSTIFVLKETLIWRILTSSSAFKSNSPNLRNNQFSSLIFLGFKVTMTNIRVIWDWWLISKLYKTLLNSIKMPLWSHFMIFMYFRSIFKFYLWISIYK